MDFQLSKIIYPNGSEKDIITTWPQLCKELLNDGAFAKFLDKSVKKSGSLTDVALYKNLSDNEKVKQAVDFVKTSYRYNGRNGYYPQKEYKEFISEKVGNSTNINLFLTGFLQSIGLEAHPVIISTREHGKINKAYPFSHYFNYVLSYVKTDKGYLLVDATDELCPYDQIPFKCLNGVGLLVKEDSEEWINLNNDVVSGIESNMKLRFSENVDLLTGDFTVSTTNYDATNFRKQYHENSSKFENQLTENNMKLIDSIKVENYRELSNPYKINFKAECPYEKIGDKLFLSPFLNEPMSKNPFKQDDRTYPIDLNYVKSRKYTSEIAVPNGFKIQELPEAFSMDNKWMNINYQVNLNEQKNTILINAQYTTKKAVYKAEDFRNLKYMYDEMIKKFNEKIIFTKAEEGLSSGLD